MIKNYITLLKGILSKTSLSQTDLAKRLGVTFASLNRWLNGHAKPHPRRIEQITKLYQELVGYPSITQREFSRAIARANGFKRKRLWGRLAKNQSIQDELLLDHTYNSTAIEGSTFSKRETEAVVFQKQVLRNKTLIEHLEMTNHAAVLRGILNRAYQGDITETIVKSIHHDLMQGIREDAGAYATHHRAIRGIDIVLTHPKDIAEEMGRLLQTWANNPRRQRSVQDIAHFHTHFELIHPFGDGNGRVGRLLLAWQCLQLDYPPVVIENARKAEYYDALEYAQRKSETPFILFLIDEMERTSNILRRYQIV